MSSLVYSVANPFLVSVKNQAILKEADISTDTRNSTISFQFCTANIWPEGDWRVLDFPGFFFLSHRYRLVSRRYPSSRSLCIAELDGFLFIIFIYLLFFYFLEACFSP